MALRFVALICKFEITWMVFEPLPKGITLQLNLLEFKVFLKLDFPKLKSQLNTLAGEKTMFTSKTSNPPSAHQSLARYNQLRRATSERTLNGQEGTVARRLSPTRAFGVDYVRFSFEDGTRTRVSTNDTWSGAREAVASTSHSVGGRSTERLVLSEDATQLMHCQRTGFGQQECVTHDLTQEILSNPYGF